MTEKLFDRDPYANAFSGTVIDCQPVDGGYQVVLDRTMFFPEQGGQTSDTGFIEDAQVLDVQIKDGIIYHLCDRELEMGAAIEGQIDWTRRFNNMQQHTGEHIFTGLAHNRFGAENVGFHLSDNVVTLDLNVDLSAEDIASLEQRANLVIAANIPVNCWFPGEAELAVTEYRSKGEVDGPVRLVEIEGVDICACCAPHVASTGEVGMLKVQSAVKYKGGVRVSILCGMRALKDYRRRIAINEASYQALNCMEDEIPEKIRKLMDQVKGLQYELASFKAEKLRKEMESISGEQKDAMIFTDEADAKAMRDVVNTLVEMHSGICGVFAGNDDDGYNYIVGSASVDCKELAAKMREELSAKGGGSPQMIQGSVKASAEQIKKVLIGE